MTNIVVILADQLRADFLGCYGGQSVATPSIDALAACGIVYDRAISPCPLCVPARASLMTGENAITTGVVGNRFWLRPDRRTFGMSTWAETLADAGYATSAVGKCHFFPWDASEGFGRRIIAEDKRRPHTRDNYYDHCRSLGHAGKPEPCAELGYYEGKSASFSAVAENDFVDVWTGTQAVEEIERLASGSPFALFVGFNSPHCPYNPPQSYLDRVNPAKLPALVPETEMSRRQRESMLKSYASPVFDLDLSTFTDAEKLRIRLHYAAMVALIDDQVGRIVEALDAADATNDTVIIVTSDHGDHIGDFGLLGKSTFLEPSVRIPMILSAPKATGLHAEPTRRDELVTLHDLHATLLRIGGQKSTAKDSFVLPGLAGAPEIGRRDAFGMLANGWAMFQGTRKVIFERTGEISMFDVATDPQEQRDLTAVSGGAKQALAMLARLGTLLPESVMHGSRDRSFPYLTYDSDDPFHARGFQWEYPLDADRKTATGWAP